MILVSETILEESEWFITNWDMSLPSTRYWYLRWPFFLYEPQLDQLP